MSRIHFRINYQGHKNHLEVELHEVKIITYWKIEGQLQASFFAEIHLTSNEAKVYTILKFANSLWSSGNFGWTINGPHVDKGLDSSVFLTTSATISR
jgi:hypothetical protein